MSGEVISWHQSIIFFGNPDPCGPALPGLALNAQGECKYPETLVGLRLRVIAELCII